MTKRQIIDSWHAKFGQFFSRRFKLFLVRNTWGKSPNTPMHETNPTVEWKAMILLNDLLTTPEFHELLIAEAMAFRQLIGEEILKNKLEGLPLVSTPTELLKAEEALLYTMKHGLLPLEPVSDYETKQLRLAERQLRSSTD